MKATPRAILYTRVSTCGQAEHGTSLDEQLAACRRTAEQIDAQIVGHEEDAGISGALLHSREGMQRALEAIEAGKADTLIIANLSRFSRDREHQSAIKKRVEAARGRIVFCDMDFADTPEGDLAFGIMGSFADYERKMIRERTVKGRRRRAEEGTQPSRSLSPYGYHIVTKEDAVAGIYPPGNVGTYQIIEEEACFVREMFARCARGESLRAISRSLVSNHAPLRTLPQRKGQTAATWHNSTILGILRHPVHKGQPYWGRTQRRVDENRLSRKNAWGQPYACPDFSVPVADAQWIPLSAPAIVSEELWETCQQVLDSNRERRAGRPGRRYMLSGLLRCPRCGLSMGGFSSNGQIYYRCRNTKGGGGGRAGTCISPNQQGAFAEQMVTRAVSAVAQRPEMVATACRAYEERARGEEQGVDIKRLQAELRALDARERATIDAQIAGVAAGASSGIYTEKLAAISRERSTIQATLAAQGGTREGKPALLDPDAPASAVSKMLARIPEVLEAEEITPHEKHDLLARVVEKVVCDGNSGYCVTLSSLCRDDLPERGLFLKDVRITILR